MTITNRQSGFSAVELLITLFVAAAFIGTSYQLYAVIVKDSGESRFRAKASNIAYDNLRRYSANATNPCTAMTVPGTTVPADSGLPSPEIAVTINCPFGSSSPTSKIQVSMRYGTPQVELLHVLYVTE